MNALIFLFLTTTSPLLTGYSVHTGLVEGKNELYGFAIGSFGQFGVGFWRKVYGEKTNPSFAFEFTSLNVGDTTDYGRSLSYSMGIGIFGDFKVMKFTPYVAFYFHFLPSEKFGLTFTLHYAWGYMDNRPHGLAFGTGVTFFGQPKEYSLEKHRELEKKRRRELAEKVVQKGIEKLRNMEIDSAILYFEYAIKLSPEYERPYKLLGEAHLHKGIDYMNNQMPDSALPEFALALKLNPQLPYLQDWYKLALEKVAGRYFKEGQLYLAEKDYGNAIKQFKKAFEVDSTYPVNRDSLLAQLYFEWGMTELDSGDYESAVRHFEKSMRYDSSFVLQHKDELVSAYLNSGIDMISSGKLEDGINRLEQAIDLAPELSDSVKGQLAGAYFDYGFSLSSSDKPEAHLMFALGHFYSGDREHTLEELRKFYDQVNQTPELGRPYIKALLRLATSDDPVVRGAALSAIEAVAKAYPNDVKRFVPELIPFIDDPDATCRYEALLTISWIARADHRAVTPYIDRIAAHLHDDTPDIRFAAITTLASIAKKAPKLVSHLTDQVQDLLNDPDDYVRSGAEEFMAAVKNSGSEK